MRWAVYARFTVLVIPITILLLIGALLWLRLTTPFDGVRLVPGEWVFQPSGVEVEPIDQLPDGIHWGDMIVAVDGRDLASWTQDLLQLAMPVPRWQFGQTLTYTVLRAGVRLDIPIHLERYPLGRVLAHNLSNWLLALACAGVTLFIVTRRPENRAVRILFLWTSCLVGAIVFYTLGMQVSDLVMHTGFWLQSGGQHTAYLLFCSGVLHFTLIFPTALPTVQKNRWLVPTIYVGPLLLYILAGIAVFPGASNSLDWLHRWVQASDLLTALVLALILIAILYGYERARRRALLYRRTRLVVLAIAVCISCVILLTLVHFIETPGTVYLPNSTGLWLFVIGLLIPLALIVAMVRYRLFRIRIIVNRTLVYTLLTVIIIGIYVLTVGALGELFQASGNLAISLLATGLIAAIVQPLRERLQRAINHLMYGQRDDPYSVVSRLGRRLEATLAPGEALPALVETVATSLRLPYVAIALKQDAAFVVAAAYGVAGNEAFRLPILYQRETIGHLMVTPRAPGESLTRADRQLLEHLALQAGVAAHTVNLTDDLQRSREKLVVAREEERRRLRRDLHDGLGPALAGISLKLQAARNLLASNAAKSSVLLDELTTQVRAAGADIRRLVYELRPPELDELGLVRVLRDIAAQCNASSDLEVKFNAPATLPELPAALEVAVYRIASEALTNVVRHAQATQCEIRLVVDRSLALEISDNGRGLAEGHHIGIGLQSMRERAEELGGTLIVKGRPEGGTRVLVNMPFEEKKVMERIRVMIVDDHPMFRDGLSALLNSVSDTEIVGQAESGTSAIDLAAQLQPDVILMDIEMAGLNGIDATRRIVTTSPHIGVIMLTMHEDDESVFAAMRAGARGYLLKEGAHQDEILRAIRAAANGEALFSQTIARRMMAYFSAEKATLQPFPELTDREREILQFIAQGYNNLQIADKLVLSPKTVRNHVSNIYNKLQVADRVQAIISARQAGFGGESL